MDYNQTQPVYDRICIGRFAHFYVTDGAVFNEYMRQGRRIEDYFEYQNNHASFGRPYQVYEYEVNGRHFIRAHIVTVRSSGLVYVPYYGTECVVVYNGMNPFEAKIETSLTPAKAKEMYGIFAPVFTANPYAVSMSDGGVSHVEAAKLGKHVITGFVLAIVSFQTGILTGWVTGPLAIVFEIIALNKKEKSKSLAFISIFMSAIGIIEGFIGLIMLIGFIFRR